MDIAFSVGFLVLLRYSSANDVVDKCQPLDEGAWTNRSVEICNTLKGQRYHCFKYDNGSFVEMCIVPSGLSSRECPFYDPSVWPKFKYRSCNLNFGRCPTGKYYPSHHLYLYSACLHYPTTKTIVQRINDCFFDCTLAVKLDVRRENAYADFQCKPWGSRGRSNNSDYSVGITQQTTSKQKQFTTGIMSTDTARVTVEQKRKYVLSTLRDNQNMQENSTIFESDVFKGILAFSVCILVAFVCLVIYVVRRKHQMDPRMTYSNAVAFHDNTENIYATIVESPAGNRNSNTSSFAQPGSVESHREVHDYDETPCNRLDESETEEKYMRLCDADMEPAVVCNNNVEVPGVNDTAPSLLGFL